MEIGRGFTGMIAKSVQFAFERFRRASPLETLVRPAAVMRAYFPVAPDEKEAIRKLKQSPHLDHLAWEKAIIEDYGGVLQLGPVIVSIANRTRVPVTIVDIRSRVLTRRTQAFAAKHGPPIGGPFGIVHLWFDLDRDLSPGLLVDPNSTTGFTPQSHGPVPLGPPEQPKALVNFLASTASQNVRNRLPARVVNAIAAAA